MREFEMRIRRGDYRSSVELVQDTRVRRKSTRTSWFTEYQKMFGVFVLLLAISVLMGIIVYEQEFKAGFDIMLVLLAIPATILVLRNSKWGIIYLLSLSALYLYIFVGSLGAL